MKRETILENEHFSLWYYPEEKIIHHKLHKFIYGEAFKSCLNRGTEALQEIKATKWLSDDRLNAALSEEDSVWGRDDWLPRTVKAGWKFWALVMPEKATGQMMMRRLIKDMAEQGLTIEVFDDVDEALAWLKNQ